MSQNAGHTTSIQQIKTNSNGLISPTIVITKDKHSEALLSILKFRLERSKHKHEYYAIDTLYKAEAVLSKESHKSGFRASFSSL